MASYFSDSLFQKVLPVFIRKRLAGREALQAAAENTGWLLVEKLSRLFFGLVVGSWVARYLGPAQFGQLAYALAMAAFFQAFANLGLDGIIVRDISRAPESAPEILGTALRLRVVAGLVAWVGAIATTSIARPGDADTLLLVGIVTAGITFQSADIVDLWFQSQSQSRRSVVAKLFAMVLSNAVKVCLLMAHAPLKWIAVAQFIEVFLAASALVFSYTKFRAPNKWTQSWQTAGRVLREGWPLLLGGLSVVTYMRINQVMLRELVGERELGMYSAVLPFAEVWNIIPMTICTSVAPLIARKKLAAEVEYLDALQKLFSFLAWIACLIALLVAVMSSAIVNTLLGADFSKSVTVLSILGFAAIPIFLGVAQGIWIVNEGKSAVALIKTVSGAVSSIALNLLLIPSYGAVGAAVATVISQFISAVMSNVILAPDIFKMQLRFYKIGFRI